MTKVSFAADIAQLVNYFVDVILPQVIYSGLKKEHVKNYEATTGTCTV